MSGKSKPPLPPPPPPPPPIVRRRAGFKRGADDSADTRDWKWTKAPGQRGGLHKRIAKMLVDFVEDWDDLIGLAKATRWEFEFPSSELRTEIANAFDELFKAGDTTAVWEKLLCFEGYVYATWNPAITPMRAHFHEVRPSIEHVVGDTDADRDVADDVDTEA